MVQKGSYYSSITLSLFNLAHFTALERPKVQDQFNFPDASF